MWLDVISGARFVPPNPSPLIHSGFPLGLRRTWTARRQGSPGSEVSSFYIFFWFFWGAIQITLSFGKIRDTR